MKTLVTAGAGSMNRNPVIAILAIAIRAPSARGGAGYFTGPSSSRSGQTESDEIKPGSARITG